VFLIGAAIAIISIYLFAHGNDYLPDVGWSFFNWYAWVPFGIGAALMILAVFGCCFSKQGNICFLSFYALLQAVSGILLLVIGSCLIVLIHKYMSNIINTDTVSSGLDKGIGGAQREFSDFMLGVVEGCCDSDLIKFNKCPNTQQFGLANKKYCYLDKDAFLGGQEISHTSFCSIEELEEACESLNVHGFLQNSYDIFTSNVLPAGIAITIFGGVLIMASCLSCRVAHTRYAR